MSMYPREVILEEIEQFRNDNPDDGEFYSVVADYIEQIQDESAGYARREVREEPKDEPALPIALGIHVYKIINEKQKFPGSDPAQLAYAIATELDFNYTFYYKRGTKV
jgi:hypothetical protein